MTVKINLSKGNTRAHHGDAAVCIGSDVSNVLINAGYNGGTGAYGGWRSTLLIEEIAI